MGGLADQELTAAQQTAAGALGDLVEQYPREVLVNEVRQATEAAREELLSGKFGENMEIQIDADGDKLAFKAVKREPEQAEEAEAPASS